MAFGASFEQVKGARPKRPNQFPMQRSRSKVVVGSATVGRTVSSTKALPHATAHVSNEM